MAFRLCTCRAHLEARVPGWDTDRTGLSCGGKGWRSTRFKLFAHGNVLRSRTVRTLYPDSACVHVVVSGFRVHSALSGLGVECARVSACPCERLVSPRDRCACIRDACDTLDACAGGSLGGSDFDVYISC